MSFLVLGEFVTHPAMLRDLHSELILTMLGGDLMGFRINSGLLYAR